MGNLQMLLEIELFRKKQENKRNKKKKERKKERRKEMRIEIAIKSRLSQFLFLQQRM